MSACIEQRQQVVAEARRWLGARWHHEACVRYQAADCGQILIDIFAQCGLIERPVVQRYFRQFALHKTEERYLAVVEQYAHPVKTPMPGDIAVFRSKLHRPFSHGGVIVDWPMIIHADIREGVVLADASCGNLSAAAELRFYSVFGDQQ